MTASGARTGRSATSGLVAIAVLLAAALLASARTPPIGPEPPSRQLTGLPPLEHPIQDQGSSIALPDGRTLWLFADTAQLDRVPRFFVTSSAGIATGTDLRLRYLTDATGTPIEFLPRTPAERADQVAGVHYTAIWPTGATMLPDGRIMIAYAKYAVRLTPAVAFDFLAGGLFSYRYPGWSTAPGTSGLLGAGPADRPANRFADDLWGPADGPIASPVYADGYVYFTRCPDRRCYSVRSPPALLADRTSYRWWTGSGWSPDVTRRARISVGSDVPGRNPSIGWSSALKLFVMADTTAGIPSTQGLLWVARHPWGPWSPAAPFDLPDCPRDGCYTLNVHPERSPPGTVRVSFATSGVGPYVRVVDVPVQVDEPAADDLDPPLIRTRDSGSGCGPLTLTRCPNLCLSPRACSASRPTRTTSTSARPAPRPAG